jgi:hypothetical protein
MSEFTSPISWKLRAGIIKNIRVGHRLGKRETGPIPDKLREYSLIHSVYVDILGPTHPSVQWMQRSVYLELKRQGHKSDQSPPSGIEVKNCTATTSLPYIFWCDA